MLHFSLKLLRHSLRVQTWGKGSFNSPLQRSGPVNKGAVQVELENHLNLTQFNELVSGCFFFNQKLPQVNRLGLGRLTYRGFLIEAPYRGGGGRIEWTLPTQGILLGQHATLSSKLPKLHQTKAQISLPVLLCNG